MAETEYAGNDDQQMDQKEPEFPEQEIMDKEEVKEMTQMSETAAAALEEDLLQSEPLADDISGDVTGKVFNAVGDAELPTTTRTTQTTTALPTSASGCSQRAPRAAGNGHRFPSLTPSKAHIARLPSPRGTRGRHRVTTSKVQIMTMHTLNGKMTFPPRVTMAARASLNVSHPSNYVTNSRRTRKVVTWDVAMGARPPLRIDMDGPTPCTYSPNTRPPLATSAPKWTFGAKSFVEKSGGSRTSWEKTWFQSADVWTQKADFHSDKHWPPPSEYKNQPALGPYHPVAKAGHAHTIGTRTTLSNSKRGSETEPSPTDYNPQLSDAATRPHAPAFTHSFRRGGTVLWSVGESQDNPGPAAYTPRSTFVGTRHPAYTIQGVRRDKSFMLGPYAAF